MKVILVLVALALAIHGLPISSTVDPNVSNSSSPVPVSEAELYKKNTKNPPVYSPLERKNKTATFEEYEGLGAGITVSPSSPPFLDRLTPSELSFWKKVKHSVDKALKEIGDKIIDGIGAAIGGVIAGSG